jgi:hypothetical protein
MLHLSKALKIGALAGMTGLGVALAATPASAHSYVRCDYDGDRCVRVNCDWNGDDCWRASAYYNRPYYNGNGRWVCDGDGDDCRWVSYHPYYRHYDSYGYGPRVGVGFGFHF